MAMAEIKLYKEQEIQMEETLMLDLLDQVILAADQIHNQDNQQHHKAGQQEQKDLLHLLHHNHHNKEVVVVDLHLVAEVHLHLDQLEGGINNYT